MSPARVSLAPLPLRLFAPGDRQVPSWMPSSRPEWLFAALAISVVFGTVGRSAGADAPPFFVLLSVLGGVTCGWSWMLSRSLFRPADKSDQLLLAGVVVGVMGLQGLRKLGVDLATEPVAMLGSTFVVLTVVEPLRRALAAVDRRERRFAASYTGLFMGLVGFSMIVVSGAEPGSWAEIHSDQLLNICAVVALGGSWFAVRYRKRHPLVAAKRPAATTDEAHMAERIDDIIVGQQLFLQADLKVADVADRLGVPEYKVSRCLTGSMGQTNFNRYLNDHRIRFARAKLRDPSARDQSILAIALDSGFGSVGPFNRAFKEATGMTPSAYRKAAA